MPGRLRPTHTLYALIILISVTGQAQWVPATFPDQNHWVLSFVQDGAEFFAVETSGVYRTKDGTNWDCISDGLTDQSFTPTRSFCVSGAAYFMGTISYGLFRSTDKGISWNNLNLGHIATSGYVRSLAVGGQYIFVTMDFQSGVGKGDFSDIYRSSDEGISWQILPAGLHEFTNVNALGTLDSLVILAGTMVGIRASTDYGVTWQKINSALADSLLVRSLVLCGDSWYVATHAASGAYGYSGGAGTGVYKFTRTPAGWVDIPVGLEGIGITSLAVNGSSLFAGGLDSLVWVSTDGGIHWTVVDKGLPKVGLYALKVFGSFLYAGTDGKGVWRRPLSELVTSVEERPSTQPRTFALEQNFPNPFNPLTVIHYTIAGAGSQGPGAREAGARGLGLGASKTMLVVYDVLGRQVATLVDEVKEPGSYEVRFDGAALSSGPYYYQLTSGASTQTRMMVLVR